MSRKEARSQKPEARIGTRQEQKRVVRSPIPILASGFWLLASLCILAQEHVGQYSQVDVETGFNLYNANCITCHGANGDSIPGVNLRSGQFRRASTDSDLNRILQTGIPGTAMPPGRFNTAELAGLDRKSTRLNSSHLVISYAVFCLKKKKKHCSRYYPLI